MTCDIAIVGAGIVGLATGFRLLEQMPHLDLSVIEKEKGIAYHQTGHNSGVIHSGIYYTPGSLRAKNCTEGYRQLLDFCEKEAIPYDICGKVIVATQSEEIPQLNTIYQRGIANGLSGIKKISRSELLEIEPHVNGKEAIWVPQGGIIDYKTVAAAYLRKIEAAGGQLLLEEEVKEIIKNQNSVEIVTQNQTITAKLVINCAGLHADKVAKMCQVDPAIQIVPFRGEYYELTKESESLVNGLIYPVPNPAFPFLGVHFTKMIQGGVEAGPNAVLAFKREGYKRTDLEFKELFEILKYKGFQRLAKKYWREGLGELYRSYSKKAFVKALQHLIPSITADDLKPGGAGVRASALMKSGIFADDYLIYQQKNVINVCNAPSPAATSSLSIGKTIAEKAVLALKG